ncbi:uncharacterized protein LOC110706083 [Chenopodium quinoa]|uniref:uncharacterized protein LOC110706083 n=1 Tax=Chenopodium quinoa TaxID=63459 RepID=UPI000B799ED7|nr:uncharacterized protein LOC110706083 [Chenopodium quinoa]
MAGGKSGQSSKKLKGKEKMTARALFIDDQDEEMFDAEAIDLGLMILRFGVRYPVRLLDTTETLGGTLEKFLQLRRNTGGTCSTWAPQVNELVKVTFRRRVATRLRDMFYTITHKMNGAQPSWLSEEIHKEMINIVASDPTYKERSAKNKKNRRGGSMENPVRGTHFQVSLSATQHEKRMVAKNKGQLPTAPELFLKTHFKELPRKGIMAEAYRKRVEEASTQRTQKSPNELCWEIVGGRNKKGRVKGLGGSADLYYGSQMGRLSTSSLQYTPSLVSQMQDQMENKVQALREEMELEMEARVQASVKAQMEEMERRWEERMMSRFPNDTCSTVRPPRDPRDDDPGSGGAGQGTPTVA